MTATPVTPNGIRYALDTMLASERRKLATERTQLIQRLRAIAALDTDLAAAQAALGVLTETVPPSPPDADPETPEVAP